LDTSGVPSGSITVTAACRDARGLTTQAEALVMVENPPVISPEVTRLEGRLALHSIYFPTAQPRAEHPNGGLLPSQEQTLVSLASDFQKYRELKPGAHLILGAHADPRGSVEYNQALSERRVERTRNFLVEHGIQAGDIETKAFGEEQNMTDAQVRDAVERNPELTPDQRKRVLDNMTTIILASNRRVDVTLSTTGQQSVRQYPFNAADALTLLKPEGTHKTARSAAHRKAKPTNP
jgi:outer membrane protein OmpA-like peptidoglycan-associated protein